MNVQTEKFNQYLTIQIEHDPDPVNPRKDYDHVGTMACFHSRYDLGDEHSHTNNIDCSIDLASEAIGWPALCRLYRMKGEPWEQDLQRWEMEERVQESTAPLNRVLDNHYLLLPLYLYDHSSITMSTGSFACPWDSGQVGYIYVSKADAIKHWGKTNFTKKVRDAAIACLEAEVKEYDHYINGRCYGFTVERDGEELESCWGFLGDWDYCLNDAKLTAQRLWSDIRRGLIGEFIAARYATLEEQYKQARADEAEAHAFWQGGA